MPAAVPAYVRLAAHQPQVGLVDQGGRLQRLAGFLLGHLLGCQPAQLVVDQWQQEQAPIVTEGKTEASTEQGG